MVKLSAALQAAADEKAARRESIIAAGGDPESPENQKFIETGVHAPGDDAPPPQPDDSATIGAHPGNWVGLTDASTGQLALVDATALTHIIPGHGSRPNRNPKLQATAGNEMGPVTEIGTIGGTIIRVLEDVAQVASMIGLRL